VTDASRVQVVIIGAGPAGLLLGRMLDLAGIDNAIFERESREHCEARLRAGVLEQGTTGLLAELKADARLRAEGLVHGGIELRFDGQSHRIAMDELTGGRSVTVYGQTELVKDLIALRLAEGGPIHFETEAIAIEGFAQQGMHPTVHLQSAEGNTRSVTGDVVVAADGFHGVSRQAIPETSLAIQQQEYPYAWLGILAAVPPSCDELIYAHHERGFALHSMRSRQISRLYIQVDPDEQLAEWSDERVWDELEIRLGLDGWTLHRGPVLEKSIIAMRSFVATPMRHGMLFLVGDAAHIVPPTGAKGLNLAASDVWVLGPALIDWIRTGDERGLDAFSDTCMRRVWRAQDFSYWMTTMLHRPPEDRDGYLTSLQRARLSYVCSSEAAARSLAENYVGLPSL
jgi:p-hydroxybenzoate 3-monooxygenase